MASKTATPTAAETKHRAIIEEHEQSGLSLRAFARKRGLSAAHLSWWRHEIKRRELLRAQLRTEAVPQLLPVRVVARSVAEPREATGVYEVVLGRRVLRVPADFEPAAVAALVRAVESASC